MAFYDEMQELATELLTEFKQDGLQYVKITKGNGPVHNPGPSTRTIYDLNAVATGVAFKYVQSGLAVASDLQTVLPVDSRFTPDMDGIMSVAGRDHKIVQVLPKPPTGTIVAYTVIMRKGE